MQKPNKNQEQCSMKIQPLGDRVMVEPLKEENEVKKGGIIIPDSA